MKKVLLFSGLCGLSALLLLARSPGGVEGVDAWFKAAPVSGNLQGRYQWLDFSGDSVVQYAQNRVPGSYVFTQDRDLVKSLNFNPALDFSKGDTPKWSELRRSSLIQGTFIGVFAPYTFTTEGVVYGVLSIRTEILTGSPSYISKNSQDTTARQVKYTVAKLSRSKSCLSVTIFSTTAENMSICMESTPARLKIVLWLQWMSFGHLVIPSI